MLRVTQAAGRVTAVVQLAHQAGWCSDPFAMLRVTMEGQGDIRDGDGDTSSLIISHFHDLLCQIPDMGDRLIH